jgi:hypothetical protein
MADKDPNELVRMKHKDLSDYGPDGYPVTTRAAIAEHWGALGWSEVSDNEAAKADEEAAKSTAKAKG